MNRSVRGQKAPSILACHTVSASIGFRSASDNAGPSVYVREGAAEDYRTYLAPDAGWRQPI